MWKDAKRCLSKMYFNVKESNKEGMMIERTNKRDGIGYRIQEGGT
jgi:hypothetical protein